MIFYPFAMQELFAFRLVATAVLSVWIFTLAIVFQSARILGAACAVAAIYIVALALDSLAGGALTDVGQANSQRYLLLIPLGIIAGFVSHRRGLTGIFAWSYLTVALSAATLGTFEFFAGTSLYGRNFSYFIENGRPRALVASDHPLVLGLLFLIALAFCLGLRGWIRVTAALFFTWAVWTTGSEGPIILSVPLLALAVIPKAQTWVSASAPLLKVAIGALAIFGLYMTLTVWTPTAAGASSAEYSRAYRTAMYSLLPNLIAERPFGYGLNGLPEGRWLISTEYKGVRDIGVTIDSEIFFLAAVAGAPGVIAFLLMVWLSLRALPYSLTYALALLGICAVGAILAVTVWNGLAVLTGFLVGVCLAADRERQTQLSAARR